MNGLENYWFEAFFVGSISLCLFDFLFPWFWVLYVDAMDDLDNLRQIATQRLIEVNERVEIVYNFVEGAHTCATCSCDWSHG